MSDTLKEFLVTIRYAVDSPTQDRFERSIGKATLQAELLGRAIASAAEQVVRGVSRIAQGFEDIFFASQRTYASVQNIKAFSYAVSQLGGSYDSARQSIEQFTRNLRSNPGYESWLNRLGVATAEAGKLRDTVDVMLDLEKVLRRLPYYQGLQIAEDFGIDEATYNALMSGEFAKRREELRAKQRALGVDSQKAAESGKELTQAWRSLGSTLALVGEKLAQELGPSITRMVRAFDDFLLRHSDKIVAFFREAANVVGRLAVAFLQLVEKGEGPIVEMFAKFQASLDAWQKALMAFGVFLAGTWLLGILAAFGKLSEGWGKLLRGFGINPLTLAIGGALALSTSPLNVGEELEINRRRASGEWGPNTSSPENPRGGSATGEPMRPLFDNRTWRERNLPRWLGGKDPGQGSLPTPPGMRTAGGDAESGGGTRRTRLTPEQRTEMAQAINKVAGDLKMSPEDLATIFSFETGGTFHPWQKGPTTQWGTHRGLIQWGEPQRRQYGITENSTITQQVEAVGRYLRDRGYQPGMDPVHAYAAINAGAAHRVNARDAHNGGTWGTVADKWNHQMGGHRRNARALLQNRTQESEQAQAQGGTSPVAGLPGDDPATLRQEAEAYRRAGNVEAARQLLARAQAAEGRSAGPRLSAAEIETMRRNAEAFGGAQGPGGRFGLAGPEPLAPAPVSNRSVEMSQSTTINVQSQDPSTAASLVMDGQANVNSRMLRNLQGAVR